MIVSLIVGVGVTMVSVVFPARRAAKVPPVAAMRPEVGFAAISSSRRLIGGIVVTSIGAAMFVIGLFLRPGGSFGLIVFAGGGALLIFVGVSSLSTTVARPVAGAIGKPIEKAFGAAGKIARDNAMRSPRRTARTASALMIGVALISAAALFTASVRDTFGRILDRSVTADFIVSNPSFLPTPGRGRAADRSVAGHAGRVPGAPGAGRRSTTTKSGSRRSILWHSPTSSTST